MRSCNKGEIIRLLNSFGTLRYLYTYTFLFLVLVNVIKRKTQQLIILTHANPYCLKKAV
jgi:hypothetical protein